MIILSYLGITKRTKQRKNGKRKALLSIIFIVILIVFFSIFKVPGVSKISNVIISTTCNIVRTAKGVFTDGFSYFESVKALKEENGRLQKQIGDLKYKLLEINTLEADNESLRIKLGIQEKYNHFSLLYADIIMRDYDNWKETFTINKGREDGLRVKQAVIAEGGLVGYISKVNTNTSVVKTVLDPNVAIGVDIASINKNALIKGDFSLKNKGHLKLTYIPIDVEISISEIVYTSGIGGVYPKGIPVGNIIKVVNKKNEIDRYAVVEPLVDIENIKEVAILQE